LLPYVRAGEVFVFDSVSPTSQSKVQSEPAPIFSQKLVERCHVMLPDSTKPIGAIAFEGQYYVYVKFFANAEAAQRGAARLVAKGNAVILTRAPKGLVLWVYEAEAVLATKS
jgi:hypothetical protein